MRTTTVIAELCIYILTWNVGTHEPNDVDLTGALSLNGSTHCPQQRMPDIYVISMQEVNVKAKSQLLGIFQDDPWTFKAKEFLEGHNYIKIDTEQLQGILIMLYSRPEHITHMKDIETQSTRTGFGGLWGNKGAVSIRMSLYGTGVSFVGAHLAAHDGKLKERIEDYHQIVNNHHYNIPKYTTIFDHDFVFWFGDLNFRLSGEDTAWDVRSEVERSHLTQLYERDQLLLVRRTGNAFALLEETMPNFPPTFKFIENTTDYDLKRRPAWCDRILYRVQNDKYPDIKLSLEQLSYTSHPDYVLSDHKPVSAEFLYKIEAESFTDDEIHEMTHGGAAAPITIAAGTPLASVIICVVVLVMHIFY